MKNIGFYFIILFSLFIACDDAQRESEEFTLRSDSQITIPAQSSDFFLVTISPGNNLVFKYNFDVESDPKIADSGFYEEIIFEIDPDIKEFNFTDEELADINCFYRQSCFCPEVESIRIVEGTISGEKKNSSSWEIKIDVKINLGEQGIEKSISGTFKE